MGQQANLTGTEILYNASDYSSLLGMDGFSETLLKTHFGLYQGYVANTNKLLGLLREAAPAGKTSSPEYAELRRRLGWEFNGMRLHELYFENLGGDGILVPEGLLAARMTEDFGGPGEWAKDFKVTGAMRGIGWVVLYQDVNNGRLINFWINEHDTGHPAGCNPILVMDVFEHAYMLDYAARRADYIEAFFRNINWEAAEGRLL
ncbi:superoxide dismutase [Anaeroselena agilis]|uniref:superoxide dismutase n=1 Tax=Anaeroselena agilis TaxID=3063788 RepID=A0ABU3NZK9_9FIRM|nr:Fe-Mn family superoxide dismutase [Selenomonadales bacterium 4137-cl]